MANENNTKQKRGRKKGSSDSVNVKIADLVAVLPLGDQTVIPVRRKWIEQMKALGVDFEAATPTVGATIQGATDTEAVPRERLIIEEEIL